MAARPKVNRPSDFGRVLARRRSGCIEPAEVRSGTVRFRTHVRRQMRLLSLCENTNMPCPRGLRRRRRAGGEQAKKSSAEKGGAGAAVRRQAWHPVFAEKQRVN